MKQNALAVPNRSISEILSELPADKKALIKRLVAKDATDDELELFFHVCARNNTHPLDRLIVFTKFTDSQTGEKQMVLISTIDFFRARSFAYGDIAGIDPPVFDGEIEEANGQRVPAYARVTGYKLVNGQRVAYHGEARWTEFCPQGKRKAMWLRMPHNMLAKCAEAQLHRKIAPVMLHNVFLREELEREQEPAAPLEPANGVQMLKQLKERQSSQADNAPPETSSSSDLTKQDDAIIRTALASQMLELIRRRYPAYKKRNANLSVEDEAAINQLIVDAFGVAPAKLAELSTRLLQSGMEKLESLITQKR